MAWYALFCTADIPLKTINHILEEARIPNDPIDQTYRFWLATDNECASFPNHMDYSNATVPPVEHFSSPFIGATLQHLKDILTRAPEHEGSLDRQCFAVLDERTLEDGSVLLCSNELVTGMGWCDYVRCWPRGAAMALVGVGYGGGWVDLTEPRDRVVEDGGGDVLGVSR